MPRRFVAFLLFSLAPLSAAIWKGAPGKAVDAPGNPAVWKELGLKGAEQAVFGSRRVIAYEMQDATGAVAALDWLRASDPKAVVAGRFVLTCSGECPGKPNEFLKRLPNTAGGVAPTLPTYLPQTGAIAGSERYLTGPAGLAEFAPGIPESLVGFQFSPEADVMRYRTPAGEAMLAVFAYPAPQMARQQAEGFRKLNGAFVKRSGPLVAIALGVADKNAAWDLLNQVNYEAQVTMNEAAKRNQAKSIANMILSIFALAGILILFCFGSGLLFAGGRILLRRFGIVSADEAMTSLHLSDG
ncbi:MAG TPA: hypothetical protein VMJ34_18255 [Bryobacteraceae bacterium]|nr:hypothetical protein [Bryobacteraceae bacterium]